VSLFLAVRGRGRRDRSRLRSHPRLERTLPKFTPTKEDSHGNEEEEKEEDAEIVRERAGLVLGPRKTLRFCGVCDPAKRPNAVRPLLLSEQRN
jgi:hypothetical protein